MIGTLINTVAVVLGSLLGLLLRKGIREDINQTIMQGLGLCVFLIGIQGALNSSDTLMMILSIAIGGCIGSALTLEDRVNQLGIWAQRKLCKNEDNNQFAQAFVSASMLFCIGAMAVVGSLDSSIRGDHSTLIAKAVIDGITAIVFTSSMGIGVILSAALIFLYQGTISLLGSLIAPLLTDELITAIGAVGGLLIAGIGFNMLFGQKIKVINLLPSLFLPCVYLPVYHFIMR